MRFSYFLRLFWLHLRQYPGRVALSLFVLLAASTLMLLLADLGGALRFRLGTYLARIFPEEELRLEPRKAGIGPMALESTQLNDQLLEELRAMPQVGKVTGIEAVRVPVRVQAHFFGQDLASDVVIHGMPREMVADALRPDTDWSLPSDISRPYPIVASRLYLDLYNNGLARSANLPLINPDVVLKKRVYIVLGESVVLPLQRKEKPDVIQAEVVGLSSNPGLIALAMPDTAVRAINKAFATNKEPIYVIAAVKLHPGADADAFLKLAEQKGLVLSGGDQIARQVKSGVRLAGIGLIALAAAVFLLGMLAFYLLFAMIFHARRLDLIRLKALGMGNAGLFALALAEVGGLALVAVGIAGALNYGAMLYVSSAAAPWLAGQSWLPPDLLRPSALWLTLTSLVILVATLAPALPMLRWVFKVEPAEVLRDM